MPGRNNADNKFGLSDWIVGPVIGQGVNYGPTELQTAINDASAAGGGVVYIRPGSYTANLTLRDNVNLIGADAEGRLPATVAQVTITGNHTWASSAVGTQSVVLESISFVEAAAGTIITVAPTVAGNVSIIGGKYCLFQAGAGGRCVDINGVAGSFVLFGTTFSNVQADGIIFNCIGPGIAGVNISQGSATSTSDAIMTTQAGSGTSAITLLHANATAGTYCFEQLGGTSFSVQAEYTELSSTDEIANGLTAIVIDSRHCTMSSGAGSGDIFAGNGALTHGDTLFLGNIVLGGGWSETKYNWQPYAEDGTSPGTGVARGTACFNDQHFTVTDGFVEASAITPFNFPTNSGTAVPAGNALSIVGGPGVTTSGAGNTVTINSVVFASTSGGGNLVRDNGYFITDGSTYNLPAAATIGETIQIVATSGSLPVIQAQGAHVINIASGSSSAGGTATSTAQGDALILRFQTANNWWATSVVGNWTLA